MTRLAWVTALVLLTVAYADRSESGTRAPQAVHVKAEVTGAASPCAKGRA